MLEITNVSAIIHMKQDDDDTDQEEISDDNSEDAGESILSSDIEEDDLNNQQEVLHLDQARHDQMIKTARVALPKKRNRADMVIARISLPNLQHPAGAMAPPLLKHQYSTINILRESDIVPAQALPLPKAGGDHTVPQPKAGGDHNVPQHQKATFEVAQRFMEAIVFTKTPWPIISDGKYSIVEEAWILAIEARDRQRALAGVPVGTPSVCQLPSGPSLEIDPQTREAVSVYSVFCSSIGLVLILIPKSIHRENETLVLFEGVWQMELFELSSEVTAWIVNQRLSFESWLRRSSLMMLFSRRSSMIRSPGSRGWKCLT